MDMVNTVVISTQLAQRTMQLLGTRGVVRVEPKLWEMVMEEAQYLPHLTTERQLAHRYLSLLRDNVLHGSRLGDDD